MKKTELYANARQYYFTGKYTYKEICELTGVPERTLRNWIKESNWHRLRENAGIAPAVILENFVNQLIEMQNHIAGRPPGYRFPKPEEAETQRKLFYCIVNMGKYPTNAIASFGTGIAPVTDIVSPGEPALESEEEQLPIQEPLRAQFMPYENDDIEIMYNVPKATFDTVCELDLQLLREKAALAASGQEVAKSGQSRPNGGSNDMPTVTPTLSDHHNTSETSTMFIPLLGIPSQMLSGFGPPTMLSDTGP